MIVLVVFLCCPAYGYADPGSGLLLWQIVAASLVGFLFRIRRIGKWFYSLRSIKKDDEQYRRN